MLEAGRMADEPSDLREQNRALDEQVKLLTKTEQRLNRSQRELAQQIRRVDALNRLALLAAKTDDPAAIAALAFEMIFGLFPYQQGLAMVGDDARAHPLAIGTVAGCEHGGEAGLARLRGRLTVVAPSPSLPVIVERTADAHGEVATLLGLLDAVFDSPPARVAEGSALILPLAIQQRSERGVLVLRRLGRAKSFDEILPGERDAPFLMLIAQQVAAALAKAELVMSLRQSYAKLESAQREIVRRERLAAIGELAAVVAHEVRNPLGAIFNCVSSLQRLSGASQEQRLLVDVLSEESHRLNRIVGDLIDFSRPRHPAKEEEALEPIVVSALESAVRDAATRQVELRRDVDTRVKAFVDAHLLRRALLNLVDNAIQASHPGGVVQVRVEQEGERVTIEVSDRGHGIPRDELERIFEPFYTTKASGTGLGLAVVRRFVEDHGGTIEVRSEVDSGSVFTIRLGDVAP